LKGSDAGTLAVKTMSDSDEEPAEAEAGWDDSAAAPAGMAPLLDDLRQLAGEARTMAAAELAFQQARAQVAAAGARNLALFGLFALIFVVFALGALTIGLLLALTPLVTAWGATAIVVGGLGLAAALCLRGALAGWRRIRGAFVNDQDQTR